MVLVVWSRDAQEMASAERSWAATDADGSTFAPARLRLPREPTLSIRLLIAPTVASLIAAAARGSRVRITRA